MLECWRKVKIGLGGSKMQKVKIWRYILLMRALGTRKIQFFKKIQNQMFMDSIKFYLRFNWIYRGFDCKKIDLLSQFRLLLEEIKVLGSNYNFEELIWPNQGFNCIIIEVLWPIKDLIDTTRNQRPNQKRRQN
jgi:hypothetical protein